MTGLGAYLRKAFGMPKADPEHVRQVKLWASAALQARDGTAFAVNEIACNDPGCPGVETVILVMEPGRRTRACKVLKALDEVTEQDVREALLS
ncbi:MAG TPA: hypothetical protein VGU45_05685 [Microvirga sp.]|jgi:hypothetical protein|nr:hypothetical protein [Microvirga sp.]